MGRALENKLCWDPILHKGGFIHLDLENSLGHIWKYVKYADLLTRPYSTLTIFWQKAYPFYFGE